MPFLETLLYVDGIVDPRPTRKVRQLAIQQRKLMQHGVLIRRIGGILSALQSGSFNAYNAREIIQSDVTRPAREESTPALAGKRCVSLDNLASIADQWDAFLKI